MCNYLKSLSLVLESKRRMVSSDSFRISCVFSFDRLTLNAALGAHYVPLFHQKSLTYQRLLASTTFETIGVPMVIVTSNEFRLTST